MFLAGTGHVNKMARYGEVPGHASRYCRYMQSRYVNGLTIRSLRDGDTETVSALFARLGERSRERRFCGAKPRLSEVELANLARVDRDHHVLVGYVDGDTEPAGIARLVRDGSAAEVAFAVADSYHGRGRLVGVEERQRLGSLDMSWRGGERELVVGL